MRVRNVGAKGAVPDAGYRRGTTKPWPWIRTKRMEVDIVDALAADPQELHSALAASEQRAGLPLTSAANRNKIRNTMI